MSHKKYFIGQKKRIDFVHVLENGECENIIDVFGKENYRWMFIGLAVIVLGFVLMYGKEDIYDTRKIVVAPVVVLIGFAIQAYAIMKKSAK